MKKKLTSMLLLATLLTSAPYVQAENTDDIVTSATITGAIAAVEEAEVDGVGEEQEQVEEEASDNEEPINPDDTVVEDPSIEEVPDVEEVPPTSEKPTGTSNKVVLTLNNKQAIVNGEMFTLTNPPTVIDGRTLLPLRFVVDQIIGAEVDWNQETKTVTVTKEGTVVVVKIGNKTATIDGLPIELETPPIIKNGTTMLPVRFMSEAFGITTSYDSVTKTITLEGQDTRPNEKPVASFYFKQPSYTAGQTVQAGDMSTDPDGDKIVAKLWRVVGETITTNAELSNIFKTPKAGTYIIGLQVKDSRGLWSDWTEQEITILPNEAPIVTSLSASKSSYAQGENLSFTYTYKNETWETIINEKWMYRHANEDASKAVLGKPKALFTEGDYIITLQIDDAYGNRSEIVEVPVHITSEVLKSELMYRFTEGSIGEIIDNFQGINYQSYAEVFPDQITTVPGTMIMSDSPEVVKREGILYKDKINGTGRILIHHLNGFENDASRRLVLVAENTSDQPVTLTLENKTIKGPVSDVLHLGQKLLYDYLQGSPAEIIELQPGERKYIYDSKGYKWTKDQCISGLMDVKTTGEVTFTTAAVGAGTTINNMEDMELLQQDVHPRGTFDTVEINYNLTLDGTQPTKLLIGKGTEDWVNGYDAITLQPVQNRGNFGISYHITITATEDMGIILNPRGTVFKGAIKWENEGVYNVPETGTFSRNTVKSAVLGTIKKGETKTFEYMLPNGSSAPVLIGFIPTAYWNN